MNTSTIIIPGRARYAIVWLTAALLAGCGLQAYQPKPLLPAQSAQRYLAHDPDSTELHRYLQDQGYDAPWPIREWDLRELTYSALFFHPQLDVARAQWRAAMAGEITAAQRPLPGVSTDIEHHSDTPDGASPWTLGLAIDLPVETAGKRQARIDRATSLSQAARLDIAQSAWQVRSRVQLSLLEYRYAQQQVAILQQEVDLRGDIVAMLERRLDVGMVSSVETSNARLLLQRAQQSLAAEQGRIPELRAALAGNSGLPYASFKRLQLADTDLLELAALPGQLPQQDSAGSLQQAAMLNRLDLRAALARYAAAEAKLRLEVARQYPDLVLSPGYSYDQGDKIWSLGFSTLLTMLHGNRGLIAEATALREVEATQFEALQAQIITDLDQAEQRYLAVQDELAQARRLQQAQQARTVQTERQFDAGFADRLEFTTTRLENLLAAHNSLNVAYKLQRAAASLEDILQLPLQQVGSMPDDVDQAVTTRPDRNPL